MEKMLNHEGIASVKIDKCEKIYFHGKLILTRKWFVASKLLDKTFFQKATSTESAEIIDRNFTSKSVELEYLSK